MTRAGWYGREGQRRQRWWCQPKTGQRHRFTETLPRIVAEVGEGHACPECATQLEPWEGQPAPRLYGFHAKHIAYALAQVATGAPYRSTAAMVRAMAGRELDRLPRRNSAGRPLPPATQHGQLVADWVDVFAPVIWDAYAPTEAPERAILDEDEFRYSQRGIPRGLRAFYVLGVYGYTGSGRPYVASLEAIPTLSQTAWTRHLAGLQGSPLRVVTDGGGPVTKGAAAAWPAAELRRCEFHLGRNISDKFPRHVREAGEDPLYRLFGGAQRSVEAWDRFQAELLARSRAEHGFAPALAATAKLDTIIRHQAATRAPVGPHSTGPLEQFFRELENSIGDRAAKMTNKRRADALLKLLAARHNGWLEEERWAHIIRGHLASRRGLAREQRLYTDSRYAPSLR